MRLGFRTLANGHAAALRAHGPVRARVADAKGYPNPLGPSEFPPRSTRGARLSTSFTHGILFICARRHILSRPSNLLCKRLLASGGWENMLSDVIALGATVICCALIGWAVVVLTSTRRERLSQRFGFRVRRWRSF